MLNENYNFYPLVLREADFIYGQFSPRIQAGFFFMKLYSNRETLPSIDIRFAAKIGLEKAIVFRMIEDIIENGLTEEREGHKWIAYTYDEWRIRFFPFWSNRTIQRIFIDLENHGLIVSAQLDGIISRRKFYRTNV